MEILQWVRLAVEIVAAGATIGSFIYLTGRNQKKKSGDDDVQK